MSFIKKISLLRQAFLKSIKKDFYSQFGEDKILEELISKNKNKGFYVDVGCFHPKKHSNTHLLHKRGWSGVNIDMEQDKIDLFNILRPRDYNFVGAISDKVENVKIYRSQKYGVGSTIIPNILSKKNIIDEKHIKTTTLDNVLKLSPFFKKEIDLLNIDTEGNDFKVLKSLSLLIYKPKIIIIESHLNDIDKILESETYLYLKKEGYNLKSWNLYSLIFLNSKFNKLI